MASLSKIITPPKNAITEAIKNKQDSQKQSVDINKILQPKPTALTPSLPKPKTYSGGGGGGSGGTSQPQSVTSSQVSNIQTSATQEAITQQVDTLKSTNENIKNINTMLGINQQSRYSDVFNPTAQIKSLEQKRQSVATPKPSQVDIAVQKGLVKPEVGLLAQSAVQREIQTKDYQNQASQVGNQITTDINKQMSNENNLLKMQVDARLNYWQEQVNNGLSIEEANRNYLNDIKQIESTRTPLQNYQKIADEKFNQFNKEYFETRGKQLSESSMRELERKKDLYYNKNLKNEWKSNLKTFGVSAGISAGVSGGIMALTKATGSKLVAPITFGVLGARDLSKGNIEGGVSNIGLGLLSTSKYAQATGTPIIGAVGGGIAIGRYFYNLNKEHDRLKEMGFGDREAWDMAHDYSKVRLSSEASGLAGALVGMSAVQYIANGYIKSGIKNQQLVNEGFTKNPNLLKVVPREGVVIEKDIKVRDLKTGESVTVKSGEIGRTSDIKVDPKGQRAEVEKAINKLFKSGKITTATGIDSKGNVVQVSFATTSVKQGFLRPAKQSEITSILAGKLNTETGTVKGVRMSEYTDTTKRLFDTDLTSKERITKQEVSLFESKGNVQYAQPEGTNQLFRGEQSTTKDISIFRRIFKGKQVNVETKPEVSKGKGEYISELKILEVGTPQVKEEGVIFSDVNKVTTKKTFFDLIGKTSSERIRSLFNFKETPKPMKVLEEPEPLIKLEIKQEGIRPSDIIKSRKDTLLIEATPERIKELNVAGRKNLIGGYKENPFSFNKDIKDLIVVRKGEGISEQLFEKKAMHELTHAETKNLFNEKLELGLPYSQRPSEIVAIESERLVNKKGFIELPKQRIKPFEIIPEKPTPSYVGGKGGEGSQSLYDMQGLKIFGKQGFEDTFVITDNTPQRLIKEQMGSILSARINTRSELGSLRFPTQQTRTQTIKPQTVQTRQPVFNLLNQELKSEELKSRVFQPTPTRTSQSFNLGLIESQIQPQRLNQKQLQKQDLGLKQLQIQPMINPRPEINPLLNQPLLPFASLGSIQVGGGERGRGSKGGILGSTKYNPSLGAVLLRLPKRQVTEKELSRLSKSTFSGFELREELEVKGRKSIFNMFKKKKI